MVTEQLELIPVPGDQRAEAPRCAICPQPARWLHKQQRYSSYCSGSQCTSRERFCKHCGQLFDRHTSGAGSKYCSADCKIKGYHPRDPTDPVHPACAWCGRVSAQTSRRPINGWPYICKECTHPIRHVVPRLRAHHVSPDRAHRLLTDPSCEICGQNIVEPIAFRGNSVPRAQLVVDHDHACCPVESTSCGKCVRGLLCAKCNSAAGMVGDSAEIAHSLGEYLRRVTGR